MRKVLATSALVVLFFSVSVPIASAEVKAGAKCSKKNQVSYWRNVKFTCIKSGNKLVWNKGEAESGQQSSGQQSSGPSNSSRQSNNPGTANSSGGDEIESLPIDPKAPLNVDLKGAGQGKGLTYVPFGFETGPRGEGAIGSGTVNPQPGLYAPLGTSVLAIKTGNVIKVTKLYSNDYNIMIAAPGDQKNVWEVEHVIDVKVKEGDQVKAGQPIAKVGDFDERYTPGIGLVEFGLLINSSGPPEHVCPFKKIAPSASARIKAELTAIIEADKKRGHDSGSMEVLGCTKLVSVEG